MPVKPATLRAVAIHDPTQRAMNLEANGSTKAASSS
jgi:hypothetical protein